jgi:hypothetical protein
MMTGEDGYYRIERGTNKCGVAAMVVHSAVDANVAEEAHPQDDDLSHENDELDRSIGSI